MAIELCSSSSRISDCQLFLSQFMFHVCFSFVVLFAKVARKEVGERKGVLSLLWRQLVKEKLKELHVLTSL